MTATPNQVDPSKSVDGTEFHLAKPGSKDYVAGQPVSEEELADTIATAKKRLEAAGKPSGAPKPPAPPPEPAPPPAAHAPLHGAKK